MSVLLREKRTGKSACPTRMDDHSLKRAQPGRATPIRALIFDIGRVILRIDIARAFTVLGTPTGLSAAEVWSALEGDPRWRDWQEGWIDPRGWCTYITERFHAPMDFEQFCAAWNRALDPATILKDELFVALARTIQAGAAVEHGSDSCGAHGERFPVRETFSGARVFVRDRGGKTFAEDFSSRARGAGRSAAAKRFTLTTSRSSSKRRGRWG